MGRRAASTSSAAALHRVVVDDDVRRLVPLAATPTFVLHQRTCASSDVGHSRYLADHLPDARLVMLPGTDDLLFTGDVDGSVEGIQRFVDRLCDPPAVRPVGSRADHIHANHR